MKRYIITKNEENKRLDKFLRTILSNANDSFIYKMLRKKNIKLNDLKASGSEKLKENDIVDIYLSDDTFNLFSQNNKLNIKYDEYIRAYRSFKSIKTVYEDNDIVIFNKPSDVLSQKAKNNDISLNEYLIGYLLSERKIDEKELETFRPSVLNRLDRNTKGLVICSKTLRASREVSYLIKERKIKKLYRATVKGIIKEPLKLKGYILKDEINNKVKVLNEKTEGASFIETDVYPVATENDRTMIYIDLVTGKSHQIRAHLASINHPVLGDPKYGDRVFNQKYNAKEQDLTAFKIEFPDDCKIESLRNLIVEI